eukprot:NODE_1967_length_1024_cov_322.635707.p1 GENE.NODE_1967_length_1024_cov_322.635707~~NODE_1967_length_1024_cov_322.635707.p1  ORF type:complete len:258 (+),score=89.07 NODE_1967_length_1024_cov_322.635707:3-776(+)
MGELSGLQWLRLFELFPTLKNNVPLEVLLMQMPVNHARYYSISSSKAHVGEQIHLTVSRHVYKTGDAGTHLGLASNFLTLLESGENLRFKIQAAPNFRMPRHPKAPAIMLATGTGIAPFRGFWQHRLAVEGEAAQLVLVLGCRNKAEGQALYMDEMAAAAEKGILKVFHAFSREPGLPKMYVQDLLKAEADFFRSLLRDPRTKVYICGGAHFSDGVREALQKVSASGWRAITEKGNYHEDIFGTIKSSPDDASTVPA